MTAQLNTREINLDWRIKVSGKRDGKKVHNLVGVSGLVELIGEDLAVRFVERAYRLTSHKCECKLRSGLKVVFYQK